MKAGGERYITEGWDSGAATQGLSGLQRPNSNLPFFMLCLLCNVCYVMFLKK